MYLIRYETQIKTVIDYFNSKFGTQNPIRKWRNGLIERTGYLDDEKQIEYSLHGAGCTVGFNNGEIISFDFSEDGGYDFDAFKFKIFIESTAEFQKAPFDLDNVSQVWLDN